MSAVVATEEKPSWVGTVQVMKPAPPENAEAWKDVPFAVFFLVHVVAILVIMYMLGLPVFNDSTKSSATFASSQMTTILVGGAILAIIAIVISYLMLNLVVAYAKSIIKFALCCILCFVFAAVAAISNLIALAFLFVLFGAIMSCYIRQVTRRIPFAAANLHVAAAAVKKHLSICFLAYALTAFQIVWMFIWVVAFVGILANTTPEVPNPTANSTGAYCTNDTDCQSNICAKKAKTNTMVCQQTYPATLVLSVFFMLVSFYWVVGVLKNVLQTTVAGTVASWWSSGNAPNAISGALKRALTTSFGSICFGSLLVAILRALETMAKEAKEKGGGAACIAECILGILRSLLEYINRWAFIYVGLYGFSFMQAGKCVFGLFRSRGLTLVINDDLVGYALGCVSLSSGMICAGLGLVYTLIDPDNTSFPNAGLVFAFLGLTLGVGISNILLGVVDGAVATVFVCFAEDPVSFANAHPELHQEMVQAWRVAHPEIMMTFYPA